MALIEIKRLLPKFGFLQGDVSVGSCQFCIKDFFTWYYHFPQTIGIICNLAWSAFLSCIICLFLYLFMSNNIVLIGSPSGEPMFSLCRK